MKRFFAIVALLPVLAFAQDYPTKPVRIIVPFAAGGVADLLPRMVGDKLSQKWGQPVVVENKVGAAGNIGMAEGARAAPDGYTLTLAPTGNLTVNPTLFPNLPFDTAKDCAEDGVYEFMFVAPAIPITGAVGSPTNPLAIK